MTRLNFSESTEGSETVSLTQLSEVITISSELIWGNVGAFESFNCNPLCKGDYSANSIGSLRNTTELKIQ